MIFGYENGAQALLTCTSLARTATRACISGTDARVEIEGNFYAPSSFTLIQRSGEQQQFHFTTEGRGLHYQAIEVARCIAQGRTESAVMPLDETISIMETMETVLGHLAQGR
jgi:predicted dehydrogenase